MAIGPSVGAPCLARNSASRRRCPRATCPNLHRPMRPPSLPPAVAEGNKALKRNRGWRREFRTRQRIAVIDAAESWPEWRQRAPRQKSGRASRRRGEDPMGHSARKGKCGDLRLGTWRGLRSNRGAAQPPRRRQKSQRANNAPQKQQRRGACESDTAPYVSRKRSPVCNATEHSARERSKFRLPAQAPAGNASQSAPTVVAPHYRQQSRRRQCTQTQPRLETRVPHESALQC